MIFFHEKSSAQDRTINSPYALDHSFFLMWAHWLACQIARFFWTARLCSDRSFFYNRLTKNAAKMLVFFEHVRKNKMKICQKIIKRSSKNAKRVFGRLKTRFGLFEDLFVIYILSNNLKRMLSISPEYFGEMEKMEGF